MDRSVASIAPLRQREALIAFSGLLIALLLAALDGTIVATALPTIVGELGGLARLSWVVTAYLLAQTVVTPLYGKVGDLHGRKRVLQGAIGVFLAGSALCGLSRSMTQLIIFRTLQGLGGGGLMVTAQAAVGDFVPPRERGRYQGIFGAAFALASIAGPLVGGYLTSQLSWRWIFYVNLPLGALALIVIGTTLPAHAGRRRRAIDYQGASSLAAALAGLILVADLGGSTYAWDSPLLLALLGASAACLALFVAIEARAVEPVLPLALFRNRTFAIACAAGLIVGFGLFGAITYVPLFLQVVKGQGPTASGMQMIPMMGGMLATSIVSGQVITRTGRYKIFPLLGTALIAAALVLLSLASAASSLLAVMGVLLLLGLGLGMVMQVLLIAVQNAVEHGELGVATAGTTLFRLIGGSLGTAGLGAIFTALLSQRLRAQLPGGSAAVESAAHLTPRALAGLSTPLREAYVRAFTASLDTVFLVAAGMALAGFALLLLLPERPLRRAILAATESDIGREVGEAFAMPEDGETLPPLLQARAATPDRQKRRHTTPRLQRPASDQDSRRTPA